MLSSLNRVRAFRLIGNPSLRSLSTNGSIINQDGSQVSKRSFANDKLREKVNSEFKKAQQKVLTVPNMLTFSRMATAPFIGYFIWTGAHYPALACFAFAATTDLFDGYIARKFNQSSDLGAIIDPLADKLLLTTSIIAMYNTSLMPLFCVKIFLFKDLVLLLGGSTLRYYGFSERPTLKQFLDFKNYPTIGLEPTLFSKCNTALQCLLIITQLSTTSMIGSPIYDNSLLGFQVFTCFTTITTLSQYIKRWMIPSPFATIPRSRGLPKELKNCNKL